MRSAAALALVVVALVAGCGGGSEVTRSPDEVEDCLDDAVGEYAVSSNPEAMDLIAEQAGVGAIRVSWPRNEVHIIFERSGGDAEQTAGVYKAFGGTTIERRGSVVVAWTKTPTDEEKADVDGCLG